MMCKSIEFMLIDGAFPLPGKGCKEASVLEVKGDVDIPILTDDMTEDVLMLCVLPVKKVLLYIVSHSLAGIRRPRLTLASDSPNYYYTNIDDKPGTYSFGYDFVDPNTGNSQFRTEERYPNGTVVGTYGFTDPRGRSRHFQYIADEKGYRIKSEPKKDTYTSYAIPEPTESSVTWTRPSKPKNKISYPNSFPRREYNKLQRPSVYLLY